MAINEGSSFRWRAPRDALLDQRCRIGVAIRRWQAMLRRLLTRFPRAVLVLLLVPLLGAVIWQAIRFAPMYVTDLAFSADGRHLLISLRKRHDQDQEIEGSSVVQTWDVEAGQLVDSQCIGQGRILFTPHARNLIDFSRAGHLRLLDPKTHESIREWDLPEELGSIYRVVSNGHLVVVASYTKDGTEYLTCFNSEGARTLLRCAWSRPARGASCGWSAAFT
jgi:hypothetical protein